MSGRSATLSMGCFTVMSFILDGSMAFSWVLCATAVGQCVSERTVRYPEIDETAVLGHELACEKWTKDY